MEAGIRSSKQSVLAGRDALAEMVEKVGDNNQFAAGLLQVLVFDDKEALPVG